jgi:hypothetical protein
MAVLSSKGIPRARASQAINLQRDVARTDLIGKLEAALAGGYAGAWFEPAAAQLHIGVTSTASRQAAKRVVAHAGLTADVVETPVRSTWRALLAAREQWGKRLAKLVPSQEAMIGLDAHRNAVAITLSSRVPPRDRAVLEREAATASVNIRVAALPSSRLPVGQEAVTCVFPYCEKTITSGVSIRSTNATCTAGPMMIEGNQTYLLTAGHCFRTEGEAWTSSYPGGAQTEIGKSSHFTNNNEFDVGEIFLKFGPPWTEALPTPVPALLAEWEPTPTTHTVDGEAASVEKQINCHEGQQSGARCGEVGNTNVGKAPGTEHLVEDTACSEGGDSGGPWFLPEAGKVLIQGIHKGKTEEELKTTGNVQSGNRIITNIPSTAEINDWREKGKIVPVEGEGIPKGATVATVLSATEVEISANATASKVGAALVFMRKVICRAPEAGEVFHSYYEPMSQILKVPGFKGQRLLTTADQERQQVQGKAHYFRGGSSTPIPEGEKVRFLAWGRLTLSPEPPVAAATTCETSVGGYIENPVGGGPGVGETLRAAGWNCTSMECPPGEVEIAGKKYEKESEAIFPPQSFAWPSVLSEPEPGIIRSVDSKVVVQLGCVAHGFTNAESEGKTPPASGENEQFPVAPTVSCVTDTFVLAPKYENGTNLGPNQSKLVFGAEAGGLDCAHGSFVGKIKESVKIMGFKGSELITVKG